MSYSDEEYLDIVLLYGDVITNQNATVAAEEYAVDFQIGVVPILTSF
jgi:hypothetical protein